MLTLAMCPHQHKHKGRLLPSQCSTEDVYPMPPHMEDSIYCDSGGITVCGKCQSSGACCNGGGRRSHAGCCPDLQRAGLRAERGLAGSPAMTEGSRLEHQPAGVRTFCKIPSFQRCVGMCPSDVTVRCCQLVLQAVRQPGLPGSAEPGLAVTDWGLRGSQGLWTLVVELQDGAQALGESELWCPGETTLSMDP